MPETDKSVIQFFFEGAEVRTCVLDGEPHWVGKDVAERLGYADPAGAMARHFKGSLKRRPLQTSGGIQELRVLPTADVLRLIVGSKLPAAQRFERWVFEEVLPAIQKTGGYMVAAPEETPEELALRAMAVLQATVERQKAQLAAAKAEIAEALPKVEALDRIATADGSLCITDAAKALQVRPKELIRYLVGNEWIYKRAGARHYVGYQTRTKAGYLEHKVDTVPKGDGSERIVEQVRVTPLGLAKLAEKVKPNILPN